MATNDNAHSILKKWYLCVINSSYSRKYIIDSRKRIVSVLLDLRKNICEWARIDVSATFVRLIDTEL
jgi:hypothetical protein